jgi:hypothetical protein
MGAEAYEIIEMKSAICATRWLRVAAVGRKAAGVGRKDAGVGRKGVVFGEIKGFVEGIIGEERGLQLFKFSIKQRPAIDFLFQLYFSDIFNKINKKVRPHPAAIIGGLGLRLFLLLKFFHNKIL